MPRLNAIMPVDSTHILYDEFLEKWSRARDVIEGEDRVKEGGGIEI